MMLAVKWPFFDSEGSGLWEENRSLKLIRVLFATTVLRKI